MKASFQLEDGFAFPKMETQTSSVADLQTEGNRHFVAASQQASVQLESALVYAALRQPNYVRE